MKISLIDIGSNLTHDSFAPDRDAVMARALAAGVRRQIVTGAGGGLLECRDVLSGCGCGQK